MNKYIVLFALVACALATDPPACDKTNGGWEDAGGICRYCSPLCKTCLNGAADKCQSCYTADFNTPSAGSEAACACTGTKKTTWTADTAAATPQCADPGAIAGVKCAHGWGIVTTTNADDSKSYCLPCADAQNACKLCSSNTPVDAVKNQCTACVTGVTLASGACAHPTSGDDKLLIPNKGYFAKCPEGYVDKDSVCTSCGDTCLTCTKDALTTCTGCKTGYIVKADKCTLATVNTGDNKCDASCKEQKCTFAATQCDECATGYEFTAKGKCEKKPVIELCKETEGDAGKETCKTCMDNSTAAADKKSCVCAATHYKNIVAFKDDADATKVVAYKHECTKCTKTCAAGQKCKADGSDCEADPNAVACDDATLKDAGCNKCAKSTETEGDLKDKFICSACSTDQTAATTGQKGCSCKSTTHAWNKTTRACVKCDAECSGTTPSCNLGTDGKATCGAAPTTTGTDDAGTNGILISAVSMILAVILA